MITGLLNNRGWHVSYKHVERIWRQEGREASHKSIPRKVGFG